MAALASSVQWSSDNPQVARGASEGVALIRADVGPLAAATSLTVGNAVVVLHTLTVDLAGLGNGAVTA